MLVQLEIQNVALIKKASIEFGEGLNIITGETGAGKSVIMESINTILGGRPSKDLIRTGKEYGLIQAVFQVDNCLIEDVLEDFGIEVEEDCTLVVSRKISLSEKNICRINGKIVTASALKEIGKQILDFHGQYDNQSLLRTESHIELLDSFAGHPIEQLKSEYAQMLNEYREISNKLNYLSKGMEEKEKRVDLLKFQIDEITKAKLKIGEEEELENKRLLLNSTEKIISALSSSYELLFNGNNAKDSAWDDINRSIIHLHSISDIDDGYAQIADRLEDLSYELEDIKETIRKEKDITEYNPDLLEKLEERRDLIYQLKRKYGSTIQHIIQYCKDIEVELEEIEKREFILSDLENNLLVIDTRLRETASKLNEQRIEASKRLEENIAGQLEDLEMKKTKFKVEINYNDTIDENGRTKYLKNGLDKVEFLISPNAGEPLKPLNKIASGGEMSRVMLAVKTILADVDKIPVLIFDEIDSGISGRAAQKVGEKLSSISIKHQVICVTHHAQIASLGDSHFLVEKLTDNNNTCTLVNRLEGQTVHDEIARILGGINISEITKKHADELLINAQNFKKK